MDSDSVYPYTGRRGVCPKTRVGMVFLLVAYICKVNIIFVFFLQTKKLATIDGFRKGLSYDEYALKLAVLR